MKTIKWGIIGAGNIASTFAEALEVVEGAELIAVASRSLDKAIEFKKRYNIEKAYGSYKELVQDNDIDVVYIATPHSEHKEHAILCINAGKAVLCEKPFTINAKQAQEVFELAKSKNVFIMEAMWTKFLPAINKAIEWVNNDRIGNIRMIRADFCFDTPVDSNSRLFNPALGGGSLLDVGVYTINFASYIMQQLPIGINSTVHIGETGVDEQAALTLKYSNNALAILSCAITADAGDDAIIIGTKGKITIKNFWKATEALLYIDNNLEEKFTTEFKKNGYEYEAEEVCKCIREDKKESSIMMHKDTIEIMKLMDSIRDSWGLTYPIE